MQTQIITEAGTVIGIYDPKNEQPHLTRDTEVSKADPATPADWDTAVKTALAAFNAKAKAATAAKPAKKALKQVAVDALPKSTAGRAALVAVPAAAALAASETSRSKIKAKYDATRDMRHYRPASPYYDDGFGKAMPKFKVGPPKWMGEPKPDQTLGAKFPGKRKSVPKAVFDETKTAREGLKNAVLNNPENTIGAIGAVATGTTAAAGAAKAALASRKAAKLKAVKDAHRRQNIRDAALVGAVAAPVALGTRMLTRKQDAVEKGILSGAGKRLKQLGDPDLQKKVAGQIADLSGDAARTSTNLKATVGNVRDALIPASKRKPKSLTLGQKAAIGGAGVGGLLVGRELSGPKPYPYQQQR